ncbi:dicarboxylate/amino acid:cation symporter [Pseudoduganella sp. UC29_106]|uniref:dicarboxylate/amino acid:cation symporter n=1 Tax=Pseudoduganella sp. UC29_106 TaxID=3374553 RepID=UPI003757DC8E
MNKQNKLTLYIMVALVLGLAAGYACNRLMADPVAIAGHLTLVSTLFLRLIKMILAPLVFATLVVGIAKMGSASEIGRIGLKAMSWFLLASAVSLALGLLMVNLFRPGDALVGHVPAVGIATGLTATSLSAAEFIAHLVPTSIADGMARNEILQIVVFSIFFGCAAAAVGKPGKILIDAVEGLAQVMLRMTGYIMQFAPLAVFAAVAATIARGGIGVMATYGMFMLEFFASIVLLWVILIAGGAMILGRRILALLAQIRGPVLLAFSTASSEAAFPKTLEGLEHCGVSNRIAAFVLPIGYSFNLDGSMMYCTFATMFIAQAYGMSLSAGQQLTMMLMLMLTSKGMAGVPRASLVVIAATLHQFQLPEAGLLLLLGIDHFLDMARSATNVIGNSIATAVVAKWEGELDPVTPLCERNAREVPSCA